LPRILKGLAGWPFCSGAKMARVNVNFRGFGTRFNPIIGPLSRRS
jgi:hypothetical protein